MTRRGRHLTSTIDLDLSGFDRTPTLSQAELSYLERLAENPRLQIHPRNLSFGGVQRLVEPLDVVLRYFRVKAERRTTQIRLVLLHIARTKRPYWGWEKDDWLAVHRVHKESPGKYHPNLMAQPVALLAFHLGDLAIAPELFAEERFFAPLLARRLWGTAAVERSADKVIDTLRSMGYVKTSAMASGVLGALCRVMLILNDPDITRWNQAAFISAYDKLLAIGFHEYLHAVWMGLHALSIVRAAPRATQGRNQQPDWNPRSACAAEWLAEVDNYLSKVSMADTSQKPVRSSLYFAGRWLATHHPNVTKPSQWTADIAIAFVRFIKDGKVGDLIPTPPRNLGKRVGQPLKPRFIKTRIEHVRKFFNDLIDWELIDRRFQTEAAPAVRPRPTVSLRFVDIAR